MPRSVYDVLGCMSWLILRSLWRPDWKIYSSKPCSFSVTYSTAATCELNFKQWFLWLHSFVVDSESDALTYIYFESLVSISSVNMQGHALLMGPKGKVICLFLWTNFAICAKGLLTGLSVFVSCRLYIRSKFSPLFVIRFHIQCAQQKCGIEKRSKSTFGEINPSFSNESCYLISWKKRRHFTEKKEALLTNMVPVGWMILFFMIISRSQNNSIMVSRTKTALW